MPAAAESGATCDPLTPVALAPSLVAFASENRRSEGLIGDLSVFENVELPLKLTTLSRADRRQRAAVLNEISSGRDGAWRQPMGVTVIGGLIFSTILTLLLVLPTASRLRASDDPNPTPPTPPAQKKEKKKHVVVQAPERIVIDDDDKVRLDR